MCYCGGGRERGRGNNLWFPSMRSYECVMGNSDRYQQGRRNCAGLSAFKLGKARRVRKILVGEGAIEK